MTESKLDEKVQVSLKKALKKEAHSGRLPCAKARALAETHGVPYRAVGQIADELKIKIVNCELGCF